MGFKVVRPEIETAIPYASYQTANPNHRLHYRSRHSPPLSVRFLLATRILRSRVLSTKCAGQSERTLLVTTKLDLRQPPRRRSTICPSRRLLPHRLHRGPRRPRPPYPPHLC